MTAGELRDWLDRFDPARVVWVRAGDEFLAPEFLVDVGRGTVILVVRRPADQT